MDPIAKANIVRYKLLLETETDAGKRAMIECLLAEEQAKTRPPAVRDDGGTDLA